MTYVLAIDDSRMIRQLLTAWGQQAGIPIVTYATGLEALHDLHRQERPIPLPQVVLLDITMPMLNGIEVAGVIRRHPRTETLPIVFLTSHGDVLHRAQAWFLSSDAYLTKPFDLKTLGTVLNRYRPR